MSFPPLVVDRHPQCEGVILELRADPNWLAELGGGGAAGVES